MSEHRIVVHERQTYNYYVFRVPGKAGSGMDCVVIDRNRSGFDQWVIPFAAAPTPDALRKIMVTATEEHLSATWRLFESLAVPATGTP